MVLEVAHDIKANLASSIISSFYQLQIVGAIGHLHLTRIEMCLGPVYTPSLHPHNEPSEYAPTQGQMYGFLMTPYLWHCSSRLQPQMFNLPRW